MVLFSSRVLDLCFVSLSTSHKNLSGRGEKKTNIFSPLFAVFHIKKFFFLASPAKSEWMCLEWEKKVRGGLVGGGGNNALSVNN